MSYESRIFVVERNEIENRDGTSYVYAEKIADVKMCSMYNGFKDIFDKEYAQKYPLKLKCIPAKIQSQIYPRIYCPPSTITLAS